MDDYNNSSIVGMLAEDAGILIVKLMNYL